MDAVQQEELRIIGEAKRDLSNFAPLYSRYARRIYAYCLVRVRNPAEAEDLTSQIFTKAMVAVNGFRGGSVAGWLFRIAHNTVIDYFRTSHPSVPLELVDLETLDTEPIMKVIRSESEALIRQALGEMSDEKRELIILRVVAGLTCREVGEMLGKSEGAVRVEFHRAIKQLRDLVSGLERELA
jgi:RNA polymerase sigma-70 factor (ECF subfamily)